MNWIERFNSALTYIENHLDYDLQPEEIAAKANSSSFHFQRMFHMLTDITITDYIRRRRLTKAAGEILQGSGILDVAIKYGYSTQASFTKAYSRLFGFNPGQSREPGRKLKAYQPISFHITIRGEKTMDYEIREKESFTVAGMSRRITTKDGENFKLVPEFWQEVGPLGKIDKLINKANPVGVVKGAILGVCMEMDQKKQEFTYVIGVEPNSSVDLSEYDKKEIPATKWAIFPGSGPMPQAMQDVWKRIYGEWFPAVEYEHTGGPELELYLSCEGDESFFEIWIPVK